MIPAAFEYTQPASLADALAALSQAGSTAICGGQSLIPLMRFRTVKPARLVDIGRLGELRGITVTDGAARIGAGATYREIIAHADLRASHALVGEVAEYIGDLQLRNRGTIGGALAYADPWADMPAAMLALDATYHLRSAGGARQVKASDFVTGPGATVLQPGELIVTIALPALPARTGTAYANFEKSASGYSQVGAAAVITRDAAGVVAAARLGIASLSRIPMLLDASALVGTTGTDAAIDAVVASVSDVTEVQHDPHATVAYRQQLARVAIRRALRDALTAAA